MTPTLPVRPVINPRAARLGRYPSSAAAWSTRARVASRTVSGTL